MSEQCPSVVKFGIQLCGITTTPWCFVFWIIFFISPFHVSYSSSILHLLGGDRLDIGKWSLNSWWWCWTGSVTSWTLLFVVTTTLVLVCQLFFLSSSVFRPYFTFWISNFDVHVLSHAESLIVSSPSPILHPRLAVLVSCPMDHIWDMFFF